MELAWLEKHKDLEAATEAFAQRMHNTWGVGDATTQKGVLLFLSVVDRQIYISVGSGAAASLSLDFLDEVIFASKIICAPSNTQ